MTKREVCSKAYQYHQNGCNCTQSVLTAFSEYTGLSEDQSFAIASGFGNGAQYGGLCGAASGAIMVLGFSNASAEGTTSKRSGAKCAREFERRFASRFGKLDCRDLQADRNLNGTEMSVELGAVKHCDLLVVSAAEMLYDYLEELKERE